MKIDDTPVALERGLLFQTCCALSSFFLFGRENERCLPSSAVIQHVASSLERSENVASRYFHQNPPFSLSSLSLQTNGSLLRGFAVASIKRCFPGLSSSRKCLWTVGLQYVIAEWEPAFLRQAREFPFFPFLPREASK